MVTKRKSAIILPHSSLEISQMKFPRRSGVLLHPTSLPGKFGIGDLGDAAYRFVDFLTAARQSYWQVLPLSPTGYGDSPYQHLSADDLRDAPNFPDDRVDFGPVIQYKTGLLDRAFANFCARASDAAFAQFCGEPVSYTHLTL